MRESERDVLVVLNRIWREGQGGKAREGEGREHRVGEYVYWCLVLVQYGKGDKGRVSDGMGKQFQPGCFGLVIRIL